MVLREGNLLDLVLELLCVCSKLKLGLDKLDIGLVSSVLGRDLSAELGCGTELMMLPWGLMNSFRGLSWSRGELALILAPLSACLSSMLAPGMRRGS